MHTPRNWGSLRRCGRYVGDIREPLSRKRCREVEGAGKTRKHPEVEEGA